MSSISLPACEPRPLRTSGTVEGWIDRCDHCDTTAKTPNDGHAEHRCQNCGNENHDRFWGIFADWIRQVATTKEQGNG